MEEASVVFNVSFYFVFSHGRLVFGLCALS